MAELAGIKLSICISTFNRAEFIGATIDSIVSQWTAACEVVILDGASTDGTEEVVSRYVHRFDRIRYLREGSNSGVDRDFDRAVRMARGEYCWLFSDDDLLKPGAVAAVLDALQEDYSLVLVNGEHKDFTMTNVRIPSFFGAIGDCLYGSNEMDRLFEDIGACLICICCVVIKREIWLSRTRERYYGTRFIHVGVIFQEKLPGRALVMSRPLMSLRLGNRQTWAAENFQTWFINWPALIWSLDISDSTKEKFCKREMWRDLRSLLALRATKSYSISEYRNWIRPRLSSWRQVFIPIMVVVLPQSAAHLLYVLLAWATGRESSPRNAFSAMFPKSGKLLA